MDILGLVVFVIFCFNMLSVLTMIFVERKKPPIIVSWLVIMTILPIVGFILYILIGNGLSYKTRRMIKKKRLYQKEYDEFIAKQKENLQDKKYKDEKEKNFSDLLIFNINNSNSAYFRHNDVKVFTNGEDKITELKEDLKDATHSINLL